jgi:large subunit ribosomal protein L25
MAEKTKTELNVAHRETLGKKVRALRRSGFIPANIYGNKLESVAVQVPTEELRHLMKGHGRTEVIYVHIDGEERPTFIKNVQKNRLPSAGKASMVTSAKPYSRARPAR